MDDKLYEALMQTWPARAAKGLWEGLMLPGDVYQGNVSMHGADGRTNPEVINRAANLAGAVTLGAGAIPAGTNEFRAGVRPYTNVPDSLMGYRRNGPQKGFEESNYPHVQNVQVTLPKTSSLPQETFVDQIRGMNPDHAIERAYRNWPNAIHITPVSE